MNRMKTIAGQILVAIVLLVYLSYSWNTLPAKVPTHFNGHFEADRFGTKSDILTALLIMAFVPIALVPVLYSFQLFREKKRNEEKG